MALCFCFMSRTQPLNYDFPFFSSLTFFIPVGSRLLFRREVNFVIFVYSFDGGVGSGVIVCFILVNKFPR